MHPIEKTDSSVLSRLKKLKAGIETPGRVFSLLKEEISFEKGSLLLEDTALSTYIPWALTGYDKTTAHRLRFPTELLESLFVEETLSPKILDKIDTVNLKQYFSIREYGLLERILLHPFSHDGIMVGFLLIAETNNTPNLEELRFTLHELSPHISTILYKSRKEILHNIPSVSGKKDNNSVKEIVEELKLYREKGKHTLLLTFSIDKAVQLLHDKIKDADPFRFRQDIYAILSTMISDSGGVWRINSGTLLLLFSGTAIHDEKLIIHQLTVSMNDLFQEGINIAQFIGGVLKDPKEDTQVYSFFESMQ